jgi:hypothetical protein
MRVCERLDLFDAVVAENGAVLYFPSRGMIRDQAPPPPPRLLAELDRRGIDYQAGRVIVGVWRGDEERVQEALTASGVNLERVYNRAALMLLPAGISKGEGVRQVIRELGLSFHDVLALGDAENDLDLFEVCGWAGCPVNAIRALWERADWIFPGEDGQGIAQAIVGPILNGQLSIPRAARHQISLGWAVGSAEPVNIPVRGVNVLIQGDPLSGKSWLAGGIIEHLVSRRFAVCVIDPEGDFHRLARLPGVTRVEITDERSLDQALERFIRDPFASVVTDLSHLTYAKKVQMIEKGLERVRALRRQRGLPHWVFLDEAHYSLHHEGIEDQSIGLDEKGFCLVSYKGSWMRESVIKAMDIVILSRTTFPEELVFFRTLLNEPSSKAAEAVSILPSLPRGEFLMIRPDEAGSLAALTFVATPRETPHVRHLTKYADSPLPPERRFFFRRPDGAEVATAESLNDFRQAVATVDEPVLVHHAHRQDFSRWIIEVFRDRDLGGQLGKIETRWRRGEIRDLRGAIEKLITDRYGAG